MNPDIRVAWVLPAMPRDEADPLVSYWGPMARAVARGADLEVLALRFPSALPPFNWGRARVHSLPFGHLRRRSSPRIWQAAVLRLIALHRRRPFQLIHALHGNEAGWVALLASLCLRLPLLVHLGGGETVGLKKLGYGSRCYPLERFQVAASLRRARRVTVGSAYQGRLALAHRNLSPARILRLPIGLDLAPFEASAAQRPVGARERGAKGSGSPLRLISVADLNRVKGHDLLLAAAAPWLRGRPELRLALIGGGPRLAALRRQSRQLGIEQQVEWHGQVPNAALPPRLARADLFVHASHHEAQGLALIEAAAAGLNLVSTAVGVTAELGLPDAQLAEPGDMAGLSHAIGRGIQAAESADAPDRVVAQQQAAGSFALEPVAEAWRDCYAEIAAVRT